MADDEQDVAMADSSSSDDDTMDDELSNNISSLMKTVEESPYSYDAHLQLIALLRKSGSVDPLRDARENMNKLFPLSPDIWLAWIRDESSRAESVEDKEQVLKLCQRAVSEYLSVDMWLEYCQLSIGLLACEDGPTRVRQVFDSAISAAGLHFTKGSLLWEAYREFELIMYAAVKEAGGAEAVAARDRVSSLYQRQLRVPLSGCDATWTEYESWCSEHDIQPDDNAKRDHQLAMKRLPELLELEKLVSGDVAGTGTVAGYQEYLRHELSAGSPTRVLHVLERAVADVCLSDQLWQTYTRYVDGQLRPEHQLRLAVHERAVRNLPWSAVLWQNYLLAAERAGKSDDHMQELATRALSSGLQTPVDYQTVWLTWLEYSHRRLRSQTAMAESPSAATVNGDSLLDVMRAQFEKASQQLAELFGLDGDPEYAVLQYWAAVEASCGQLQRAQQLWNDILSQGADKSAKLWLQYVRLVRRYGTTKQVRKLLQRAMEHTVDWPECILELWIEFERECGTLDTWDDMHYRYRVRMKRVEELRKKQAEREGGEGGEENRRRKGGKDWRKPAKQKSSDKPANMRQNAAKSNQKRVSDPGSLESKCQQKADSKTPVSGGDAAGFKVPPPPGYTGAKKGAGDTAMPPPPGYTGAKRELDDAAKPPSSKRAKAEPADRDDPERDSRTLFVSNLDYSATAEQLADTFSSSVSVADIRIVKDYRGRSKGFAYLELSTIGDADAALKMDRATVAGRPCFVSRLKKDGQPSDAAFKFNTGLEKNKLFVRGLPTTATVDDVTAFFSTHGEVKEARIVTYRNGHSKGLAYVEFTKSAAASQAVIATDQQLFAGKVISVAISDPPRRDTSVANPHSTAARGLGAGAKAPATGRGRGGRVQLSFTPRALRPALKPSGGDQSRTNGIAGTSDTTAAAAKSNDQFRQMLLSEHK